MGEPVETIEGWYALHDFRRIDWVRWRSLTPEERARAIDSWDALLASFEAVSPEEGSFGLYTVLGHKADLLLLHFHKEPEALRAREWAVDRSRFGTCLTRPYSYFSVVELSKYLAQGLTEEAARQSLRRRLEPQIPPRAYCCFYPMNKRRQGQDNWYMTSREERRELMKNHGIIGHKYHEEVTQVITGSQGLDDWEWGVTLFSDNPVAIKKLIYEMRFDEASARFADFGPFYLGQRVGRQDLLRLLDLADA
ncbi:MAG: heme-dependent peroxidase [Firmicutes bacterium]|nr:heme-dependent peroxidase [Bacillota bacterium]